jgi:hypothetical protein
MKEKIMRIAASDSKQDLGQGDILLFFIFSIRIWALIIMKGKKVTTQILNGKDF